MSGKHWVSLLLTAMIIVGLTVSPMENAKADIGSGGKGARSYQDASGNLFIGGTYIELGLSQTGSFGASKPAPLTGSIFFHPDPTDVKPPYSYSIGLRSDGDGWETGNPPTTKDFFLPGTIDEGFSVLWSKASSDKPAVHAVGSQISKDSNINISAAVTSDESTPALLKAVSTCTLDGTLHYTQVITFKPDDKQFKTVVTLKNTSTSTVYNANYIRRFDPDQNVKQNIYNTDNYFFKDEAGGTWIVASSDSFGGSESSNYYPIDRHTALASCKNVFCFYSDDLRAEPMSGPIGFNDFSTSLGASGNVGTYGSALYDRHIYYDKAMGIKFDIGTLAPGASTELTYYSNLNPDVEGAVDKAEDVVINITQQPISRTFVEGSIEGKLRTRGEVLIEGAAVTPTYQWYQNTSASNVGGTPISGATGSDFEIPTHLTATKSYYYYCVVSADGKSVPTQLATIHIVPAGNIIYTVKFDSNSKGTVTGMPPKQTVANGKSLMAVRDPSCTGTTQTYFKGWYKTAAAAEADLWNFADPITADMTLYAGWGNPPTLTITTAALADATEGLAYTQPIAADYTGKKALIYSAVGLPSGLSIDSATGILSGNPASGTSRSTPYAVEITVKEANSVKPISAKKTLELLVGSPPSITTQPTNQESVAGTAAHFTITAAGVPSPTYQWEKWNGTSKLWEAISGAASNTYTIAATTVEMNGAQVRCVAANAHGTATSDPATLTILQSPGIITPPADQLVLVNDTATFSVVASGLPAPTGYQWESSTDNGTSWSNITGASSSTYTTPASTLSMSGTLYRCVVRNGVEPPATSKPASLTVWEKPVIALTAPSKKVTVAVGNSAAFEATLTAGSPAPTYAWEVCQAGQSTWVPVASSNALKLDLSNVTMAMNGNKYRCTATVTNTAGVTVSATSDEGTLSVQNLPTVSITPASHAIIEGSVPSVTFTATVAGNPAPTLQWQLATSGDNWADIPGAAAADFKVQNPKFSMDGQRFRCIVTNAVGTATSNVGTLTVTRWPELDTALPADVTVGAGGNAAFTVKATGTLPIAYQWQVRADASSAWANIGTNSDTLTLNSVTFDQNQSQYQCIVSNGVNPTATSRTATLTVNSAPYIIKQPQSISVAVGSTASFAVEAKGSTPLLYQWQIWNAAAKQWDDLPGATGVAYTAPSTAFDQNGTKYRCKIENVISGVTNTLLSDEAVLTITSAPFILTNPTDQAVLAPVTASFQVKAQGSEPLHYQWEFSADNGGTWSNVTSGTGINGETYVTAASDYTMNGYLYRCQVSGSVTPPAI
ncbi:MAG: immunoglobulin domain-containing protein, partial [Clostridia bacterium]